MKQFKLPTSLTIQPMLIDRLPSGGGLICISLDSNTTIKIFAKVIEVKVGCYAQQIFYGFQRKP